MDFCGFLQKIPKVELHLHVEGAIRPATYAKLAKKYAVNVPLGAIEHDGYVCSDMDVFRHLLLGVFSLLREPEDFHIAAYECLEDCSTNSVRYAELFFEPGVFLRKGIPYTVVQEGLLAGIRDAERDFGIQSCLIPSLDREAGTDEAFRVLDEIQICRSDKVIGIGLDFDETNSPAAPYAEVFQLAKRYGFRRTAHAGREGPVANVRDSLNLLGCERIDYGYRVLEDETLVQQCLDQEIVFTTAPTNLSPKYNDVVDTSCVRLMHERGLKVTINSDDPTFLGTTLVNEYRIAAEDYEFSANDMVSFVMNSIDGAWVDDATKIQWRRDWGVEIVNLSASLSE